MTKERVPAHALQMGDKVGSGEIVQGTYSGIHTPPRKVHVILDGPHGRRTALWGRHTLIGVERAEVAGG